MSFADDIRRASAKFTERHDKIVRAATIDLFSGVIKSTPVDTGRAQGAWATSVGAPSSATPDREGDAAAIAEVVATTPAGAGQETYLSNALPYIERLENGWSDKAPAGMVTINMDRVSKIVAAAIEKNKV
ncbi:MAG: HK97 gp10 family phage protein [Pseudomonas sp.]